MVKSLQGNWRQEHLFELKQAVALFDAYSEQLHQCDRQLEQMLGELKKYDREPADSKGRSRNKNEPQFDLRTYLMRMCGMDLTRIDGIEATTALKVISEVGPNLLWFPSVKHFTSWLGLCPGTKISGGKKLSGKSRAGANCAAQALRVAAPTLRKSKSALGAYYRRLCSRLDKAKAINAVAHKLARLIYTMLTKGTEYADKGQAYYEGRYRERVFRNLSKKAADMGFILTPAREKTMEIQSCDSC
jgi:transposase